MSKVYTLEVIPSRDSFKIQYLFQLLTTGLSNTEQIEFDGLLTSAGFVNLGESSESNIITYKYQHESDIEFDDYMEKSRCLQVSLREAGWQRVFVTDFVFENNLKIDVCKYDTPPEGYNGTSPEYTIYCATTMSAGYTNYYVFAALIAPSGYVDQKRFSNCVPSGWFCAQDISKQEEMFLIVKSVMAEAGYEVEETLASD